MGYRESCSRTDKLIHQSMTRVNWVQSDLNWTSDVRTDPGWKIGCYASEKLYFDWWKMQQANGTCNAICKADGAPVKFSLRMGRDLMRRRNTFLLYNYLWPINLKTITRNYFWRVACFAWVCSLGLMWLKQVVFSLTQRSTMTWATPVSPSSCSWSSSPSTSTSGSSSSPSTGRSRSRGRKSRACRSGWLVSEFFYQKIILSMYF